VRSVSIVSCARPRACIAELAAKRNKVPTPAQTRALTSFTWKQDDDSLDNDLHDRPLALPSLRNPMVELAGTVAVPFVSSNDITAYTVFESGTGMVSSCAFDTRYPARGPIKFDEFSRV